MPDLSIATKLSQDDLDSIVAGVVEALRPMLDTRPQLVPTDTMSRIAGVSPATLDRLRRARQIPSCKIGNRRLYRPDAVIAAMVSQEEKQ